MSASQEYLKTLRFYGPIFSKVKYRLAGEPKLDWLLFEDSKDEALFSVPTETLISDEDMIGLLDGLNGMEGANSKIGRWNSAIVAKISPLVLPGKEVIICAGIVMMIGSEMENDLYLALMRHPKAIDATLRVRLVDLKGTSITETPIPEELEDS